MTIRAREILRTVEMVYESLHCEAETLRSMLEANLHWTAQWKGGWSGCCASGDHAQRGESRCSAAFDSARGGELTLEVGDDTPPDSEAEDSGQEVQDPDLRVLTLTWQAPDPRYSTELVIRVHVDEQVSDVSCLRRLLQDPGRLWSPVPTPDSLEISEGPRWTRGYYMIPERELPEWSGTVTSGVGRQRGDRVDDVDRLSEEVRFYCLSGHQVIGRAPGIQCLMYDWVVDPESLLRHFPDLRQYRVGHETWYRHPDGHWDQQLPAEGLTCLWVRDISEVPAIRQATQILISADRLPARSAVSLSRRYTFRYYRGHYLLTRRSRAKSARSSADD